LDEFIRADGERLVRDPVKRILFQRDLWGMFVAAGRPEVQRKLAAIIRRVALAPEEIESLPDNLTGTVKAKTFPTNYDSENPERAFIPTDLLDPSGPWVPFTRQDRGAQPAAMAHVVFTSGRSVFVPLLRLPGGREATHSYLSSTGEGGFRQFPVGTQTALLRRVIAIDDKGIPRMTRLTESLQIRVFDALEEDEIGRSFKMLLRRSNLISDRTSGLRSVQSDDRSLELGTCSSCHARLERGGVATLQTLRTGGDIYAPGPFMRVGELAPAVPTDLDSQARLSIDWLQQTPAWRLLKSFW